MADASVGSTATASASRGRGLAIATWVLVGVNVLALTLLSGLAIAAIQLQAEITSMHGGQDLRVSALAVFIVGAGASTLICNGLAVWLRRSWGPALALLAAAGCWIAFMVAAQVAVG